MQDSAKVRVLLLQDGDTWVAQCLEYDIGTQAPTLDLLQTRFDAVFNAECRHRIERFGNPFKGLDPAPDLYQDMWDRAPGVYTPKTRDAAPVVPYEMAMVA